MSFLGEKIKKLFQSKKKGEKQKTSHNRKHFIFNENKKQQKLKENLLVFKK